MRAQCLVSDLRNRSGNGYLKAGSILQEVLYVVYAGNIVSNILIGNAISTTVCSNFLIGSGLNTMPIMSLCPIHLQVTSVLLTCTE